MIRVILLTIVLSGAAAFAQVSTPAPDAQPEATQQSSPDSEIADDKELSAFEQWFDYLAKGGRTMMVLGLLSVLGLAVAFERAIHLRRKRIVPEKLTAKVFELWKESKFDAISALCAADNSILARVIETLVEQRTNPDVSQIKMFAEDKAGRELRLENRKAYMLGVVATIAPLLGLFGTVVGLLGAFNTVAAVGEMGDPSIMANDIAYALITTVAGLAIAMPALFCYHFFRGRIGLYGVLLEEEVSDLVNVLFVKKR